MKRQVGIGDITHVICDDGKLKRSLVDFLEQNKIQTRNYFQSSNILLHPGYSHLDDIQRSIQILNKVLNKVFFLGCSPVITDDMIGYI